jgi:hypothetical protein
MLHARGRPRTPVGEPVVAVAAVAGARVNAHGLKPNAKSGGAQARRSRARRDARSERAASAIRPRQREHVVDNGAADERQHAGGPGKRLRGTVKDVPREHGHAHD